LNTLLKNWISLNIPSPRHLIRGLVGSGFMKKFNANFLEPPKQQLNDLLEHYRAGRFAEAEKLSLSVTQEFPEHPFAWKVLAVVLKLTGRISESLVASQKSVLLEPQDAESQYNLGNTLKVLTRLNDAEVSYKKAIALTPNYADAYNNLGATLKEMGRLDEAEINLRQAIELKPDLAGAHSNLGVMLQKLGRLDEAEISLRQAIELKPDLADAYNNLGITLKEMGRLDEAETSYTQAIVLKPDYAEAHSNLLFLYSGFMYESSHYLKKAREYGQQIAKSVASKYSTWLCVGNTKILRVGMVSGDLKNHPVGYFLEEFLNQLGKFDFELYAYTTKSNEDDLTLRIKPGFTRWKSLVGISDVDAADHIYNDGIHILIDLSGHTAQNRLPIFAWKPAPVQISWLGYFASTGVAEIDYILGDPYVTPTEEANHFNEKIWQLPESYICFTEPEVDIDVVSLPALDKKRITFGCFNKIARITDPVVRVWSEILHAVPTAVLFLKDKYFDVKSVRDSFYDRFKVNGIQKDRLILEGKSPRSKYLAAYNRVDIALSPFPYGGGTTSAEGLWMGVPVITMQGNHFLSHLGESIAHNTGLSDWIAVDEEDYVAKAIALSTDLEGLEKLRLGLRAQVLSRPLFDAERFANHFKNALRGMWKRFEERDKSNS